MFNLGFSELIIIAVIALVFIGPKQLPEVARVIGRLINEWKRATSDFTSTFKDNEAFRDWEKRKNEYMTQLESSIQNPPESADDTSRALENKDSQKNSSSGLESEVSAHTANDQMELHLDEKGSGEDKK